MASKETTQILSVLLALHPSVLKDMLLGLRFDD